MDGSAELLSYVASVRGVSASSDLLSLRGWSFSALLNLKCVSCDTVFCATIIAAVLSCWNGSQNSRQQISSSRNVQVCCVTRDRPDVIMVIPQSCSISVCIAIYLSKLSIRDHYVWTGSSMHRLSNSTLVFCETSSGVLALVDHLFLTLKCVTVFLVYLIGKLLQKTHSESLLSFLKRVRI